MPALASNRLPPGRYGFTALLCLLAAGCASMDAAVGPAVQVPAFHGARHTDDSDLPSVEGFLAVDDAMRAYARDVLARISSPRARVERLAFDLVAPESPRSIRYAEDRTLVAAEVMRRREGNCLSFTALAVQLARLSGLEAHFEDVPVLPKWHVQGGAFLVERHVDTLIPLGGTDAFIDFRPPSAATYTRAQVLSDTRATARYFGNLGVDRFTAGDLEGAYRLYRRGIEVDPRDASLWLNLGVVLARNGQWEEAERAYRTALSLEPGNLSALNNLALALEQRGDAEGAAQLHTRVERYRRRNPYYLYWLGEQALQSGDATRAIERFASAVERMREEADFHFALARGYLAAGRHTDAERSLQQALRRAQTDSIRARYREQFDALPGRGTTQP